MYLKAKYMPFHMEKTVFKYSFLKRRYGLIMLDVKMHCTYAYAKGPTLNVGNKFTLLCTGRPGGRSYRVGPRVVPSPVAWAPPRRR